MQLDSFNQGLMSFIERSPTPFHAVSSMAKELLSAGFIALDESEVWDLKPQGRYFVTRNGSSLIAFTVGDSNQGVRMVGAHTDSPCLKVKPTPEVKQKGFFQLGVEVYGGALLNPWFDRDLSIAGRVTFLNAEGRLASGLVDFKRPIAVIPSLAIHLDRDANNGRAINAQKELPVILTQLGENEDISFREILKAELRETYPGVEVAKVLDYELCLYDVQPPSYLGLNNEFIMSARLDNLLSCYIGLSSLLDAINDDSKESEKQPSSMLVCSDHEEVGSQSAEGAQGTFLLNVLERLFPDAQQRGKVISGSMMISADNAHGVHPNFADKHDNNHGPLINEGPVIKINANQRYATNSETSSIYRHLSEQLNLPYQSFVVRSDMACGSTIGPITASNIGVRTLDIGVPQFAMHSIREMIGSKDAHTLFRVLARFYQESNLHINNM
ncbi:M18 family aminopeptidase [Alkalimarinus sediminis]|uniref:M18 family aminopeptidase n=1 Tax=Alkalimarinus sediminis TaxID=1632866 RepID=A0A9E8HQ32_9ALTE|nr:M18 family aminopeptidase [Alkalimarinus sediminis]UZW76653.1 M18 family aminopeptidase [Alkalimarinus sediminis]